MKVAVNFAAAGMLAFTGLQLGGCSRDDALPKASLSPSDASDRAAASPSSSDSSAPTGQARMVARLDAIAATVRIDNPYFGEKDVGELEKLIAGLPERGATKRRWRFEFLLGWNLTRLGRFEEAIEHLKVAHSLSAQIQDYLDSGDEKNMRLQQYAVQIPGRESAFELGLAYLRLAETANCLKHHTTESCILPIRGGGVHVDPEPAGKAITCFLEVLAKFPDDYNTRFLLNVSAMAIGEYPERVPEQFRIDSRQLESAEPFPRFTDVAAPVGLNNPDLSGGAAIEDFDGDGDLDVVTTSIDPFAPIRLMRHQADGSFENVTDAAGLAGIRGGLNLIAGDYDNDGDVDLLVLRGAWWKDKGCHPNSLLRNDGDFRFVDVTYAAGLGDSEFPTQAADFADFDNDGDLDLYIGNEHGGDLAAPSELERNDGNGTFTDIARPAGVENERYAKGVAWGDYDGDGFPDLYVSNYQGDNRLYRNRTDATFTDVAPQLGLIKPKLSFPVMWFDFENDGDLDIVVASFWNHPSFAAPRWFGAPSPSEPTALYRNDRAQGFTDIGAKRGLANVTMSMGANFGDLDNDGFIDVYFGTGYPNYDGIVPNLMMHNREGREFSDVTSAGGFGHLQKGHGVVFADLDGDGDEDVFEQMGGAFPGDGFPDALYENPGTTNHFVAVRLIGVKSNRFGIGATIRVVVPAPSLDGGAPVERSIYRTVDTGGSFGVGPHRKHIGIGAADRILRVEVVWPTSQRVDRYDAVPIDRAIDLTEGQPEVVECARVRLAFPH